MAKVWNRAFWRPAQHRGRATREPAPAGGRRRAADEDPREERRRDRAGAGRLPWPMVVTTAALVLVGVGITVVAGPLYGYAQRAAADLVGGTAYVRGGPAGRDPMSEPPDAPAMPRRPAWSRSSS